MDHPGSSFKGYCGIVMFLLCMFGHRRVVFFVQTDDVDQSVVSSIFFQLVAYNQTIRASNSSPY